MNPLQLGLRNLLGELLPGAVLLIALAAFLALAFPVTQPFLVGALSNNTAVVAASILLASYIIGSVIRLYAADTVDKISAFLAGPGKNPLKGKDGTVADHLDELLARATNPNASLAPSRKEAKWIWTHDRFPYPVWEVMKIRLYHPPEMFAFFMQYRNCFATRERRGKEFFNYCKTVIYSANEGKRHALADEVQIAEARVRFFAGTFWSLTLSAGLLFAGSILSGSTSASHTAASAAITFALVALLIVFGGQVRKLRLKDVDTVFDAFYIVHRHANECSTCVSDLESAISTQRKQLLHDAFSGRVRLQDLIELMKGRAIDEPELSSLYFAGADCDHPYFLVNDRVALGIAVLPEAQFRSAVAKQHPHQHETIVVLDGELYLDVRAADGERVRSELKAGEVTTIRAGQCHRILPKDHGNATFLFIKTWPAREPRGEPCSLDAQSPAVV